MSENLEAQTLAEWLDGAPGGTVPETLDPEVAETIFALRPEYAPAPSVTIEAVLASLTDGPLVDPAIGEALRHWLEAGPGTPPPEILPIGVVEAFYALRPDMAPAPRLGIEDILNSVTEGPFAANTVEAAPAPSSGHPKETARSRARRRWWTAPSLTVAAVAATTIFFVGPMSDRATEGPPSQALKYAPSAPSASADAPQLHTVTFEEAEEVKKVEEVKEKEKARIEVGAAASSRSAPRPSAKSAPARRSRAAVSAAPPPPPAAQPPAIQKEMYPAAPTPSMASSDGGNRFGSADEQAIDFEGVVEAEVPVVAGATANKRERKRSRKQASRWYQGATGGGMAAEAGRTDAAEPSSRSWSRAEDDLDLASEEMSEEDIAVNDASPPAPPRTRGEPLFHETEAQARSLFAAGEFEKALERVDGALKLRSNSPFTKARLLRLKADILIKLGRETDAQKARAAAARIDPTR